LLDVKKSVQPSIHISVDSQRLTLKRNRKTELTFPVSTSKYGLGCAGGSFKTPTGRFRIAEKIGSGQPVDIAYKSRVPLKPSRELLESADLVMSRILWLDGLEEANANTYNRYIYIHGTNHEEQIGEPASHGCVRMKNADIAKLFELVEVGTAVTIMAPRVVRRRRKKREKSVAPTR
jgi:lipoprotein-anchoring transpeptidase ErfK/SrfK